MLVVPHVSSREWCMMRILMKCAFLTIFITCLVTSYKFLFWLLGTLCWKDPESFRLYVVVKS